MPQQNKADISYFHLKAKQYETQINSNAIMDQALTVKCNKSAFHYVQ